MWGSRFRPFHPLFKEFIKLLSLEILPFIFMFFKIADPLKYYLAGDIVPNRHLLVIGKNYFKCKKKKK